MTETNLRPELARHVRQRLQAFGEGFRHNLAIIGPHGSGKTFQLQQLLSSPPANVLLISCPLYHESCRSFLHRLLSAILQAGLPTSPLDTGGRAGQGGATASQPLDALLARVEPHCPKTVEAIRPIEGLLTKRLFGEAFNRALDAIPVLMGERGQPCVFILDEFLCLEELGLAHAFHELGKRVMIWPSVLFILSSSSCHRARTILRERLQLLFGQFELVTLETVELSAASAWMQKELRGVRGAKAALPFLLQWLGSSPWYLSLFLKRLKELTALGHHEGFTEALFLETAWDVLGSPEGPLHQWCASLTERIVRRSGGARALEALMQVADGARTTTAIGQRIGRAGLTEALHLLIEHDVARRNGTCWMVTDPALRCWLSSVLSTQRSELRVDSPEVRQRFEQYLRGLWTHWMHVQRRSFPEQVVDLFAQFNDETVSLDSKTGRLPKFDTIRTEPLGGQQVAVHLVAHGQGKQWCATVREGPVDEQTIATFETFCRTHTPRPARKVVITTSDVDPNARLLAKTANMWVWGADDLKTLRELYGGS